MHYWFDGGHMIWMTISWLLVIGVFTVFLGSLIFAVGRRTESEASAEEILRRRYAAGEMGTEEYENRLAELRKTKQVA